MRIIDSALTSARYDAWKLAAPDYAEARATLQEQWESLLSAMVDGADTCCSTIECDRLQCAGDSEAQFDVLIAAADASELATMLERAAANVRAHVAEHGEPVAQ